MQRSRTGVAVRIGVASRAAGVRACGLLAASWLAALALGDRPALAQSRSERRSEGVSSAEAAGAPAIDRVASSAGEAAQPIPVRMAIDLQDEYSRSALQQAFAVLGAEPDAARFVVVLHHVPLGRHPAARAAAAAAHAARRHGKELEFVRALLARPSLHTADVRIAAESVGLDADSVVAERASPVLQAAVEHERRAAVAFGVRATPTALIGGQGLVGVVPAVVLRSALAQARSAWARCSSRGGRDCEREVVRRKAPGSLAALAALRGRSVAGQPSAPRGTAAATTAVRGSLGERWRLMLTGDEPAIGAARPEVIAAFFFDVTDPDTPAALDELQRLVASRPWLRVALLPLGEVEPGRGGASPEAVTANVALLAALRSGAGSGAGRIVERLAAAAAPADSHVLAARLQWSEAERVRFCADTGATVAADRVVRLAIAVDARPGTLYVHGRRWRGVVSDAGLDAAFDAGRAEAQRTGRKGLEAHARLVADGRVRDEAEIDLDGEESLGDLSAAVDLEAAGPPGVTALDAWLFVDFTQAASRAAFHALRLLRTHAHHPVRLRLMSIASSAEPGVSPPSATLHVCAQRGKALDCALGLFGAPDANDWIMLRKIVRRFGITPTQLGEGVAKPAVRAAMAAAAAVATRLDMVDDPVIYLGNRRYLGPIDENRIIRAVAAAHRATFGGVATPAAAPPEQRRPADAGVSP